MTPTNDDGRRCTRGWAAKFNIHGLATLRVAPDVAGFPVMQQNFEHFEVAATTEDLESNIHIDVYGSVESAAGSAGADLCDAARGPHFSFGRNWFLTDGNRLFVAGDQYGLIVGSDGNVDRALLLLLDWIATGGSACLVHGAAVALDGAAAVITGWGGVGKTATLASLCRQDNAQFLADDMVFLTADSQVLGLPKPMFIYPYHRYVFPELFASSHKPLVPTFLTPTTERLRQAVRPAFTRVPRLENLARRLTPEHMKVRPQEAIPGLQIRDNAELKMIIRLERSNARFRGPIIDVVHADEIGPGLVHEFAHEVIEPTGLTVPTAASASGVRVLQTWLADRASALAAATSGIEAVRIRLGASADATVTSRLVSDLIEQRFG